MPDVPVAVSWQIATDEGMKTIVREGTVTATPEWAHSVHVEVEGLEPDRWYWYRFKVGSDVSLPGRTRTMPASGAEADRLRFAFASCQRYDQGYYTAYEHMAEEDLDLVVHLGDYIYESKAIRNPVRPLNGDGATAQTLRQYRDRFALYKSDPILQRVHAQVPWIVTWDDHETWNNMAGAAQRSTAQLARRAAAYKAFYEHMPLRAASLPHGPDMQIYRNLAFGNLVNFFVLDTRQYRTLQPPGPVIQPRPAESLNPNATLLGDAQRTWLFDGLKTSPTRWNTLAQQVMVAPVNRVHLRETDEAVINMDQWGGYEVERRRLLSFLHDTDIRNAVVLTGDIHANYANDLIADFDKLDSRSVATELVGTSISSGGDGIDKPEHLAELYSENPFVKYHNLERGYVRCEVTPDQWRADYRTVDYVTRPGAPVKTKASFVVEPGRPFLHTA